MPHRRVCPASCGHVFQADTVQTSIPHDDFCLFCEGDQFSLRDRREDRNSKDYFFKKQPWEIVQARNSAGTTKIGTRFAGSESPFFILCQCREVLSRNELSQATHDLKSDGELIPSDWGR